jgi:hypothetical protein
VVASKVITHGGVVKQTTTDVGVLVSLPVDRAIAQSEHVLWPLEVPYPGKLRTHSTGEVAIQQMAAHAAAENVV